MKFPTALVALSLTCATTFAEIPPAPPGYKNDAGIMAAVQKGEVTLIKPPKTIPDDVDASLDMPYGKVGDRVLNLDLYRPKGQEAPRPCVVIIHGGAWAGGDKRQNEYKAYIYPFAEKGYVVASVGYRLSGEAQYPAAVQDTMCSIRYLRSHAEELRIDPDQICVMGWSAGGHLALMIGAASNDDEIERTGGWESTSSSVNFVVNMYGVTDLTADFGETDGALVKFMPKLRSEAPDLYKEASPLYHLDSSDPPVLTMHGSVDSVVPIHQADALNEKLEELGIPHEYDRVEGWSHVFDMESRLHERAKALMFQWLERYMPVPAA